MTTSPQHRPEVYPATDGCKTACGVGRFRAIRFAGNSRADAKERFPNFAVGFSRQPLPKGNRFAIVTNAGGPGIMATDAAIRHGLELAKLRPETLESLKAKLPPTANLFHRNDVDQSHVGDLLPSISTAEEARAGFNEITNGVKQKLPGARLLGVEMEPRPEKVHPQGRGAHVASARIVLAAPPNHP